jgi:ADP-ribose pyrophosphatase YjhB (NUDIX family)
MDPFWLDSVKRVLALAQNGLAYADNPYDIERYEELRRLGGEMLARLADSPVETIVGLLSGETGYQTPKVDIRGVVLRGERVLLVRERIDGFWALPGGWADVGLSPGEVAVKEVREEANIEAAPVRLLAVLDKRFYDHPPSPFHTWKLFILCEERGGQPAPGPETSEVGFFTPEELPPVSLTRNTPEQVRLVVRLATEGGAAVFD